MKAPITGLLFLLLAAAAGFAAHQYSTHGKIDIALLGFGAPEEPSVLDRASLEEIEKLSSQVVESSKDGSGTPEQAAKLLDDIDVMHLVLTTKYKPTDAKLRQAQLAVLNAKYAGARIDKQRFASKFHEFADRIVASRANAPDATHASMLKVLVKHDSESPASSETFSDLTGYAKSHSQHDGATLYCVLAGEYARNGNAEDAQKVLKHGLRVYASTPVASTLVNRMADLGLSKAKESKYTKEGFKDWLFGIETAAVDRDEACNRRT
jgi:hypothetical protein